MAEIILETKIYAPINRCFDLSRSIDLHKISTKHTKEKAIDGCTEGLINLGEYVTWEAIHFGIKQKLSIKITEFKKPFHFRDEQIKGIFKYMIHDHDFKEINDYTLMSDKFNYKAPLGVLGNIGEHILVTNYLKNLLLKRNQIIKLFAEGEGWKEIIFNK